MKNYTSRNKLKKLLSILILTMFLMFLSHKLYAEFNFETGFGTHGIGYNSNKEIGELYFVADLWNFFLEHYPTGLGFETNLMRYSVTSNSIHSLSIINAGLYWNIFGIPPFYGFFEEDIILGPFISINYLNLLNVKDFTYKIGIKFNICLDLPMFIGEIGYQNKNNISSFYLEFKTSILTWLLFGFFTTHLN